MSCGAPVCFSLRRRCEICARRARYGVIAAAILVVWDARTKFLCLDGLDALAAIMEDRHRLIRQHRRELNEEIRDAQRAGRDGYQEGLHDGRRAGDR